MAATGLGRCMAVAVARGTMAGGSAAVFGSAGIRRAGAYWA